MGVVAERKKVRNQEQTKLDFVLLKLISFRKEPPSDQELMKNLAIMQLKKKNAALVDEKYGKPLDHAALKKDETGQRAAFPSYDEYEVMPGSEKKSKK